MVAQIFEEAFQLFLSNEERNIISGVSERNLCGRFAIYLEGLKDKYGVSKYYADTEYNRKQGGKIKTIINEKMEVIVINCDVIFHSRGEVVNRDNLLAIEMKKSNRPEADKESDRKRLIAMTKAADDDIWSYDGEAHPEHVCGYELGVFIELNPESRIFNLEMYENGALSEKSDGRF